MKGECLIPVKVCSKCGKELFATSDNFHRSKIGVYGLRPECKECGNSQSKQRYTRKREVVLEYQKQYREENKEIRKANRKQYLEANKEKVKEREKRWKKNNKEKRNQYSQTRKSLKRNLPATLTVKQWEGIKSKFNHRCAYCGEESELTQEHFIPISKGGGYTHTNIIPVCGSCNSSKCNKDFFEWYPKQESYSKEREIFILEHLSNMAKATLKFKEVTQ